MFNLVDIYAIEPDFMLQKISYFNLIFAITYVLIYFRDSSINFTMGILMIVVINWLALRSDQIDNYKWSIVHYLPALWSIYYIGFLLYGTFNVLHTAIEYQFASKDTIKFLVLSSTLSITVLSQLLMYFLKNIQKYDCS